MRMIRKISAQFRVSALPQYDSYIPKNVPWNFGKAVLLTLFKRGAIGINFPKFKMTLVYIYTFQSAFKENQTRYR
jgi:hypothetical protein